MSNSDWITYADWLEQVPDYMRKDKLWDFIVYQRALFLSDLAWRDCQQLQKDSLGKHLVSQLLRSAGSVPANIEEGYGRGFGKDYALLLRISLGSAREAQGWYVRGRHVFSAQLVEQRYQLLKENIGSLVTTSNQQRER